MIPYNNSAAAILTKQGAKLNTTNAESTQFEVMPQRMFALCSPNQIIHTLWL